MSNAVVNACVLIDYRRQQHTYHDIYERCNSAQLSDSELTVNRSKAGCLCLSVCVGVYVCVLTKVAQIITPTRILHAQTYTDELRSQTKN